MKTLVKIIALAAMYACTGNLFAVSFGNNLGAGVRMNKGDYLISFNGRYSLNMQTDGNLVLYRLADGYPLYEMAKHGEFAIMQTDGNFVEYSSAGVALWSSGTYTNTGETRILLLREDGSLWVSSLGPTYNKYWGTSPDPRYNMQRYPMEVTNIGAKPTTTPAINAVLYLTGVATQDCCAHP